MKPKRLKSSSSSSTSSSDPPTYCRNSNGQADFNPYFAEITRVRERLGTEIPVLQHDQVIFFIHEAEKNAAEALAFKAKADRLEEELRILKQSLQKSTMDSVLQTDPIRSNEASSQTIISEEHSMEVDLPQDLRKINHTEIGTQVDRKRLRSKPRWKFPRAKQCYRCQRFGHVATDCNNDPRCRFCGDGHDSRVCTKDKNLILSCANCQGQHKSSSRTCPAFPKESSALKKKLTVTTKGKEKGLKFSQVKKKRSAKVKDKKSTSPSIDLSSLGTIFQEFHSTQVAILDLLRRTAAPDVAHVGKT